jgi:hypothetical protein
LRGNNLAGSGEDVFGSLVGTFKKLEVIDLVENKLTGTTPLGYFPSFLMLKHIDKSNNVFTGYADMSFTTTTFYANFSHNEFTGVSLRRFNAAYQTLKVVDLS